MKKYVLKIKGIDAVNLANGALAAVATDVTESVLTGAFVEGSGNQIAVTAMNRYIAHRMIFEAEGYPTESSFVIPPSVLKWIKQHAVMIRRAERAVSGSVKVEFNLTQEDSLPARIKASIRDTTSGDRFIIETKLILGVYPNLDGHFDSARSSPDVPGLPINPKWLQAATALQYGSSDIPRMKFTQPDKSLTGPMMMEFIAAPEIEPYATALIMPKYYPMAKRGSFEKREVS